MSESGPRSDRVTGDLSDSTCQLRGACRGSPREPQHTLKHPQRPHWTTCGPTNYAAIPTRSDGIRSNPARSPAIPRAMQQSSAKLVLSRHLAAIRSVQKAHAHAIPPELQLLVEGQWLFFAEIVKVFETSRSIRRTMIPTHPGAGKDASKHH